jgi:hypothetical protein
MNQNNAKIYQANIVTGKMALWRTLGGDSAAGITQIGGLRLSSDGNAYAYAYGRVLSQAYVVTGLK